MFTLAISAAAAASSFSSASVFTTGFGNSSITGIFLSGEDFRSDALGLFDVS